jgi:hypothetical protein
MPWLRTTVCDVVPEDSIVADDVDGAGLLQLGVNDIGQKVVFDGRATEGKPFGNKITCMFGSRDHEIE